MKVCCPNCNTIFEQDLLEEVLEPTVSITKQSKARSSWRDMIELIRSGSSYRLFNVGDVISFKLKNDTDFEMEVAGIDIYAPNTVILVARNCLDDDKPMNRRNIYGDAGGWSRCMMREYLNDDFYSLLPDDFKEMIIPRTITQKIGGAEYSSEDKIWLPSQTEMFADYPEDIDVGDKHLTLYSTQKSRTKTRKSGVSSIWYWLRTPTSGSGTNVRTVIPTGPLNSSHAHDSNGVAPTCVIG